MARLHQDNDSDDELPELSIIIGLPGRAVQRKLPSSATKRGQEHRNKVPSVDDEKSTVNLGALTEKSVARAACDEKQVKKQRPLKIAHVNSLLLPISSGPIQANEKVEKSPEYSESEEAIRPTPRRAAKHGVDYKAFTLALSTALDSDEDQSFDDLSDFIVRDSDSDSDARPLKSPRKYIRRSPNKFPHASNTTRYPPKNTLQSRAIDLTSPRRVGPSTIGLGSSISRNSASPDIQAHGTSFNEELPATLRFSPPRLGSPSKKQDSVRFVTPPGSPSRPRLQSPSKQQRIPPSSHRPSIDAFWSQEVINDWNDQYSPKKTPKSAHRVRLFSNRDDDESDFSPSNSPRKSPQRTPSKKGKDEIAKRRAFNSRKVDLATSFLQELDETVANGQVASLASSAGGIRIIWSKKLNSTAGRANWKRETIRSKNSDGTVTKTVYRHYASIELAEKVIGDEDRLINVLAHEYCHLANFMISGIKANPHGKEFKEWAKKCSRLFSHRGIEVTTKHSYTIDYKYIWACTNPSCGVEFKRHSKSIDPARHTCGTCKSKLIQVLPVPRGKPLQMSGYQGYVKENYARLRRENPSVDQKEVMKLLGKGYKEMKASAAAAVASEQKRPGEEADGLCEAAEVPDDRDSGLGPVARKLDFLNLGA